MPERQGRYSDCAVLSLGTNLGDRLAHLQEAVRRLGRDRLVLVVAISPVYETEPVDVAQPQESFLNQVVLLSTQAEPAELLRLCQNIETDLGRPEDHEQGIPRTMDVDIITYGDRIRSDPRLKLPHPRYHQRRFVLLPLADVYPEFSDPVTGRSLQQLLAECQDRSTVRPFTLQPVEGLAGAAAP